MHTRRTTRFLRCVAQFIVCNVTAELVRYVTERNRTTYKTVLWRMTPTALTQIRATLHSPQSHWHPVKRLLTKVRTQFLYANNHRSMENSQKEIS